MSERLKPVGVVYLDRNPDVEFNPIKRWSYPMGLYTHALMALPRVYDAEVRGDLSWRMDKYWRERGSANSILTLKGLATMFRVLKDKYPSLQKQGEMRLGKQQPSLLESSEATVKRLDFLYRYMKKLDDPCISVVSGGSMSYGRFYNVREGIDPSDLDLMVVYKSGEESHLNAGKIMPLDLGFSDVDCSLLQDRIGVFQDLHYSKQVDILSHKAHLDSEGFGVSMHIMPDEVFENMMIIAPHQDNRLGADTLRRVRDYKPVSFKHQSVRLNNFHGEPIFFSVDEERVLHGIDDNEVITHIPAHAIVNGTFVPGLYHNLVSPRYEMEAFSARECVAAATLFWSLMKRLEKKYRKSDPNASALKSHIRYDIFNPKLIEEYEKNNGL